jgi:hypothetical protein
VTLSSVSPLRSKATPDSSKQLGFLPDHPILKTSSKHMKFIINTAKAYFRGENGKELHRKVKSMIKTIGNSPNKDIEMV